MAWCAGGEAGDPARGRMFASLTDVSSRRKPEDRAARCYARRVARGKTEQGRDLVVVSLIFDFQGDELGVSRFQARQRRAIEREALGADDIVERTSTTIRLLLVERHLQRLARYDVERSR